MSSTDAASVKDATEPTQQKEAAQPDLAPEDKPIEAPTEPSVVKETEKAENDAESLEKPKEAGVEDGDAKKPNFRISNGSTEKVRNEVLKAMDDAQALRPEEVLWHYREEIADAKPGPWQQFSRYDSLALELVHRGTMGDNGDDEASKRSVGVLDDLYDVDLDTREMNPVYWTHVGEPALQRPKLKVRRSTWFFKDEYPMPEHFAAEVEEQYMKQPWKEKHEPKITLDSGSTVTFVSKDEVYMSTTAKSLFARRTNNERVHRGATQIKKQVKPDPLEEELDKAPCTHLVLVVHGIGQKLSIANIRDDVDVLRQVSKDMYREHFPAEKRRNNKVRYLPIQWRKGLEIKPGDEEMARTTLKTATELRGLVNATVMDVLYFLSPKYSSLFSQSLTAELNRVWELYQARNPSFVSSGGRVSLFGHSLGSILLFDILSRQEVNPSVPVHPIGSDDAEMAKMLQDFQEMKKKLLSKREELRKKRGHTGQVTPANGGDKIVERSDSLSAADAVLPTLNFPVNHFFAAGSPIGIFLTLRGAKIGEPPSDRKEEGEEGGEWQIPRIEGSFVNMFHPFDPVAYRIEPKISTDMAEEEPELIPLHVGGNRMHKDLELGVKGMAEKTKQLQKDVESKIDKWRENLSKVFKKDPTPTLERSPSSVVLHGEEKETLARLSLPNFGRVDFSLQESFVDNKIPYAAIISSHLWYWKDPDIALFVLKCLLDPAYNRGGATEPTTSEQTTDQDAAKEKDSK